VSYASFNLTEVSGIQVYSLCKGIDIRFPSSQTSGIPVF